MITRKIIWAVLSIMAVLLLAAAGCSYVSDVKDLYQEEDTGQVSSGGDYNNDFTRSLFNF